MLLDIVNRRAACALIAGYQRYLSPYKGFHCAHRLLHGGESCSQYVKQQIDSKGLWSAIPICRQRFRDCKTASRALRLRMQSGLDLNPQKRKNRAQACWDTATESCFECGEAPCAVLDIVDCSAGVGRSCSSLGHCSGLDCASLDCAGLDCAGLECGICSII